MDLIDILKIVIPAIGSSGLVAYFLSQKTKRLEIYKDIANDFIKKMIKGLEELQPVEAKFFQDSMELRKVLSSENIENRVEDIDSQIKTMRDSLFEFKKLVNLHRIYITPLIPFGQSHSFYDPLTPIMLGAQRIVRKIKNNEKENVNEILESIEGEFQNLETEHLNFQELISRLLKDLFDGKNILD